MKSKFSFYAIILLTSLIALGFVNKQKKAVREVLTGKHLFVVSITINKDKKTATLLAENRDSFMAVNYENDSSKVILDWTMCPDGKCPEAKLYYPEKPDYDQLDSLVNTQLKLKKANKNAG